MIEEELPLEVVEKNIRVVFLSNESLDGDASLLGKNRIVRRIYPLIDIEKLVESQKEDKRKLVYLKDIRSRLRGLNQRMRLRMGDVGIYTGTKAAKKDIEARDKVIKELKSVQQEDVHALFKAIKPLASPYAQPVVNETSVDDGIAFRIYRVVNGQGWKVYAEEGVENPQLMVTMDSYDVALLRSILGKYLNIEEEIINEEEEEGIEEEEKKEIDNEEIGNEEEEEDLREF